MHIDAIELYHVALPRTRPQTTPWGVLASLETVVARIDSGGVSGWGESSPGTAPLAASEWAASVFAAARDWLAPRLVGTLVDSGRELQERLAPFQGNTFAKAAMDTAWWDLHARLQGRPLHDLLGKARDAVELGTSFDRMESIDALLEAIGRAHAAGYGRVELKFRPGWDVHMLNAVRYTFPTERFHIDIEGTMRLEHMEMLCRLDDFSLAMIEQPLAPDDLVGHAMVQEAVRTPIGLDESVTGLHRVEMALDLHSARFLNVTPGRVGGITPALEIHDACHNECVPCWVGTLPQSALGTRIGLALAAKANFSYPVEFVPSEELLQTDLAPPLEPVKGEDGVLRAPLWSEPGLGVEPDREALERLALGRAKLP